MVHATNNYACPYVHATTSCPPHFLLKATMLYTYALMSPFQILPPHSRPMTSHHVTCHMTVVSCASSSSKRKIKEKKINIKENKNCQCSKYLITLVIPCNQLCCLSSFSMSSYQYIMMQLDYFHLQLLILYITIQIPQSWNENRTLDWVIMRELDGALSTELSTLCTTNGDLCIHYNYSILKYLYFLQG